MNPAPDADAALPVPPAGPRAPVLLPLVAVLLAVTGAAIALVLMAEHIEVLGGNISEGLFCGAAAGRYDCSQVAAHPSSTVAGVPLALWGFVFYTGMLALALGLLMLKDRGMRAALCFLGAWAATAALIVDGALAQVMIALIGAICLNCVATYVVNLLLAGVFWILARRAGPPSWAGLFSPALELRPKLAIVGLLVVVGGATSAYALQGVIDLRGLARDEVADFVTQTRQPPEIDMAEFAGQPSRGPEGARLTIALTGDFECTYCRAMASSLERLRRKHPADIRIVFVNSPVNSECNPGVKRPVHEQACALAELAEAATQLGKFWEYHDYVFERMPMIRVTAENAVAELPKMGIAPEAAHQVLISGVAKTELDKDVALSNRLKLINTPSLVLNGYPKRGGIFREALEPIVDHLLEQARTR